MITEAVAKANISRNLKKILGERVMTPYALAKATGEPQNTVYRIVRGENEPGTVLLARMAEVLECTVDDLLSDPPEENRKKRKKGA